MRDFPTFEAMAAALDLTPDDIEEGPSGRLQFAGGEADWGINRGGGFGHLGVQPNSGSGRESGWLIATAEVRSRPGEHWIIGYEIGDNRKTGRVLVFGSAPVSEQVADELHERATRQPWFGSQAGGAVVDVEYDLAPWLDAELRQRTPQ